MQLISQKYKSQEAFDAKSRQLSQQMAKSASSGYDGINRFHANKIMQDANFVQSQLGLGQTIHEAGSKNCFHHQTKIQDVLRYYQGEDKKQKFMKHISNIYGVYFLLNNQRIKQVSRDNINKIIQ